MKKYESQNNGNINKGSKQKHSLMNQLEFICHIALNHH